MEEIAKILGLPEPSVNSRIDTLLTDSRELENPAGTLFLP